jgi:LDH2 family malate/lactate/ureidoglycolate dehydrogenase
VFMLAIDVAAFCPLDEFCAIVDSVVRHVKSAPAAPGFNEVFVPGEIEVRLRAERFASGIPVEPGTWRLILETAAGLDHAGESLFGRPMRRFVAVADERGTTAGRLGAILAP